VDLVQRDLTYVRVSANCVTVKNKVAKNL